MIGLQAVRVSPGQAANCTLAPELAAGLEAGTRVVTDRACRRCRSGPCRRSWRGCPDTLHGKPASAAGTGPGPLRQAQPSGAFLRQDQSVPQSGNEIREAGQELPVQRSACRDKPPAANSGKTVNRVRTRKGYSAWQLLQGKEGSSNPVVHHILGTLVRFCTQHFSGVVLMNALVASRSMTIACEPSPIAFCADEA